jgi:phosphohistidine phosphatase
MERRVHLLRHAKSSWDHSLVDHDRPLAPRGQRALPALARHLREAGVEVDLVLCSTARRTVQTLEGVRPALPDRVQVAIEAGLYGAPAVDLLRRLQSLPDGITQVMLIAHNPGIGDLAEALAGGGDPALLCRLGAKYPTGALATIAFDCAWAELRRGAGRLDAFVVPRELE